MRLTIGTDDARTIDSKQHRQLLNRHVVDHLIVGALQEGGIDSDNRLVAADRQARCKRHRMLLGNGDVKILVRVFSGEFNHAGAFTHGRGDCHQLVVFRCGFAQPVAEDFGIARHAAAAFWQTAAGRVKFRHRVEGDRIFFRRFVATPFFGHDVQELRAFQVAHVLERGHQTQHVVTVNRPNIVKAQFFKQGTRHDHAFDVLFGTLEQLFNRRYAREDFLAAFTQRGVKLAGEQLRQMVV